jgi:molecular chaperone Hsp33
MPRRAGATWSGLDNILANHGYPPVMERLLAEALVLTALLGHF